MEIPTPLKKEIEATDRNPYTGAKDRDVGTGAGAVAGGIAGAAAGSLAGPLGTVAGAAAGAVIGGLAGREAADVVNPEVEDRYWRDSYQTRPYVSAPHGYDDYGPAYAYGVDAYTRYPGRDFDSLQADLSSGWGSARGGSRLDWERAQHPVRDAWQRLTDRVERAVPGDADRDGK